MNKPVIIAVVIVASSGIVRAWQQSKPLTPVILGSYVFLLVISLLDMFGGQVSKLAGALAMLAATYVLLTEFPWQTILGSLKGSSSSSNNGINVNGGSNTNGVG